MKLSVKQTKALDCLENPPVSEVLYGGSAGCFTGETLVQTSEGHKKISKILAGDLVLSYNVKEDCAEFKPVERVYTYKTQNLIANFTNGLRCTDDHKFLFNGEWTKAKELEKRAVEISGGYLLDFQHGETCDNEPQRIRKVNAYESCTRCKWLPENYVDGEQETQDSEDAQAGIKGVYKESPEQTSSKSYKFQERRQPSGKLGMGYSEGKRQTLTGCREIAQFHKGRATAPELQTSRRRGWNFDTYKSSSIRDKREIQTESLYKRYAGERVWSGIDNHKGHCTAKELETHLACGIRYTYSSEPVYDLQVSDNHNYTVTKDNIIVHNSGKSFLLSYASLKWCYKYAGIRGLLGRKTRSTLYKTTVMTLLEVAKMQGLKPGVHFTLNTQSNIFHCFNGSEILLYNLETNPSDPNYDELGSLEITFANVDECPQVEERLIEIIKSRIRYRLRDFCVCGSLTKDMKVLAYDNNGMPCEWYCKKCNASTTGLSLGLGLTANPTKNWVKRVFYDPYIKGDSQEHSVFVQALPTDNKYLDPVYLKHLANLNEVDKQRLLYGNWDYADDNTQLIKSPQINSFINGVTKEPLGLTYISADIALQGADLFVIVVWRGWHILDISLIPKSDG